MDGVIESSEFIEHFVNLFRVDYLQSDGFFCGINNEFCYREGAAAAER